jgi:L-fuculose-phosphate aldolase
MNRSGLNRGTSGNLSARVEGGMLITPSATPYEAMGPGDLIRLGLDGTVLDGGASEGAAPGGAGRPSTEWRIHGDIYRARPDAASVLHAHPEFCTTLACLRKEIPAVHYMVAVAGGSSIRCAPYATFGTPALAEGVLAALEDRTACLMANHGLVVLGSSPGDALDRAIEVEALAAVYWRALQAGDPVVLSDAEMADVMDAFEDYQAP